MGFGNNRNQNEPIRALIKFTDTGLPALLIEKSYNIRNGQIRVVIIVLIKVNR